MIHPTPQFESQARAQRHETANLEKQWQNRLAQAEHEHTDRMARQNAETAGVKEECNVAISRVCASLNCQLQPLPF